MATLRILLSRVRALFHRRRLDDALEDDVRTHLELLAADYERRGMAPADAGLAARRDFGGVEQMKETYRDRRGLRWVDDARRDVRYAVRTLGKSPGYAAVAVLTLALGIGGTTALFTIVREVLIRQLPVDRPAELIALGCVNPLSDEGGACNASFAGFDMYRADREVITGAFAFATVRELSASHRGVAEILSGMVASGETYSVLGLEPRLGRLLNPADDRAGAPLVAVLSHAYWRSRFGGDPGIIGQSMRLNEQAATIVGVTPPAFRGLTLGDVPDVTVPLASADVLLGPGTLENGGSWWLRVIVRRKPDVTIDRLEAVLEPIFHRTVEHAQTSVPPALAQRVSEFMARLQFDVQPAAAGAFSELRESLDRPLRTLTGVVVSFLLIVCANLAGLVTSRAMSRRREFSLRLALGATRGRLFRQMLTESVLLAAVGGGLGLALAQWGGPALLLVGAGDGGIRAVDLGPDGWVLAFTAAVSMMTGIFAGAGSIVRVSRTDPQETLKTIKGQAQASRLGKVLLAGQCALTIILLVGAGLFLRTLANLRALDLGFATAGRIVADVAPSLAKYDEPRSLVYLTRLVEELDAVPGVLSTTFSLYGMGRLGNSTLADVPGFESAPAEERAVGRNAVGPRFAETTGLRLLYGRDIALTDTRGLEPVALVNESFARHFFGTANAVGRRFKLLGRQNAHSIVGVVSDARDRGVKEPSQRVVYEAFAQSGEVDAIVTVRGSLSAASLLPGVERTLRQVDAGVLVRDVRTVETDVDDTLRRERLLSILTTSFGGLAILLVALGLYGTLSGIVVRRTQEIGVRTALGATRSRVMWLVTHETLGFVLVGVAVGLAGAVALTRVIQPQLVGVSPSDPVVAAGALAVLLTVAVCAALVPARRAARVDPMVALRYE